MSAEIRKRTRPAGDRTGLPRASVPARSSLAILRRAMVTPSRDGQRKQVDEALRVFGVITSHVEARQVSAVQGRRRAPFGDGRVPLVEPQADGASDALLRLREESIERLS